MDKYPLPRWLQGQEHWTQISLSFWLKLPHWTAEQAKALLFGVDPERDTADRLMMLDGVTIESSTTDERCKVFFIKKRSEQERFLITANAHGITKATPNDWIDFANKTLGITPGWSDLAINNKLIPGAAIPAGTSKLDTDDSVKDWMKAAQDLANQIGLDKWKIGIRQITARNICNAVAEALGKDEAYWGARGPRSGDSIRGTALKGWKFVPPKNGVV